MQRLQVICWSYSKRIRMQWRQNSTSWIERTRKQALNCSRYISPNLTWSLSGLGYLARHGTIELNIGMQLYRPKFYMYCRCSSTAARLERPQRPEVRRGLGSFHIMVSEEVPAAVLLTNYALRTYSMSLRIRSNYH